MFERVCRENGIRLPHTQPRTPTTTGKIERFHQTVRRELLDDEVPFASMDAAQEAVDAFAEHYNTAPPHQALEMAFPADRFFADQADHHQQRQQADEALPLRLPASLSVVVPPAVQTVSAPPEVVTDDEVAVTEPMALQAIEVERVVPDSGNLSVGRQQVWLGPDRAGLAITLWISTAHLHVFTTAGGGRLKTVASRLTVKDLTALVASGAAGPAGPAPVCDASQHRPAIEVDRLVSSIGVVSLAGDALCIGAHLAGQRVTLRLDGITAQVMDGGRTLLRAVRCPLPITECGRLRGARRAGPPPAAPTGPVTVQRTVSIRGGIMVVGQKIQVGRVHARKILDVTVDDTHIAIHADGEPIRVVSRTTTQEITRIKFRAHLKQRKSG
ncbi:integrase core domain-containing protein [Streptosporangium sp. NPDC023825]|uniref:integrase core domain-containing protein n=1 Tax=Streptosporangium sp. NPDC023825 TaxID=3154909 RepID=UPI0034493BCC